MAVLTAGEGPAVAADPSFFSYLRHSPVFNNLKLLTGYLAIHSGPEMEAQILQLQGKYGLVRSATMMYGESTPGKVFDDCALPTCPRLSQYDWLFYRDALHAPPLLFPSPTSRRSTPTFCGRSCTSVGRYTEMSEWLACSSSSHMQRDRLMVLSLLQSGSTGRTPDSKLAHLCSRL